MNSQPAIVLVLLFLVASLSPLAELESTHDSMLAPNARATGVDLTVNDVSFSYTSSSDEARYRMFSSNHPIPLFNRPAELYVVDTVVDVPIYVELTIENLGTNPSGTIDVQLKILHDEYQLFEMVNVTQQMSALNGGSSNSIGFTVTPTYAGNHSLQAIATSTVLDDQPSNNQYNRHFTVASHYFNCDDLSLWTTTNEWGTNSDTSLSEGSACHVGNGEASTYGASTTSLLETPTIDMSDAVNAPTKTNGVSFFYTGSSQQGDEMKFSIKNGVSGQISELGTLSGTIDQAFLDGASWQTFSVANQGTTSPLVPASSSAFSSATTFQFVFTSNAIDNDIGFWLDDIVIVYDQKVKPKEYAISSTGVSTNGALPGDWGSVGIALTNDGNISDYVMPSVENLPVDWDVYFAHDSGVSINTQTGVLLAPGETKIIHMKLMPDENATTGFNQLVFTATSSQHQSVNTSLPVQFQVLPDREPLIIQPEERPSCPPGYTCPFDVEIQNIGDATDVFDLVLDQLALPSGWGVQFSWAQSTSILVRADQPVLVGLSMTVPLDATPDTVVSFSLQATSQNNTEKFHSLNIGVAASMISEAYVGMTSSQASHDWFVDAGESKTVSFTIWNNASRQDIFSMTVEYEPKGMWMIEQPSRPDAVINPGGTTTFTAVVTAPDNAQAGEQAPALTPKITSERSGMSIEGDAFEGIKVSTIRNLGLSLVDAPDKLRPGASNKFVFDLVNNGNGPASALLAAETLPSTWSVSYRVDGENTTGPIALNSHQEGTNNITVEGYIYLPSEESASVIHTLTFTVSDAMGEVDIDASDNSASIDTITASVRIPSLEGSSASTYAMVGTTVSVQANLTNIGNAMDDGIIVKGMYSSSPPNAGIVAFFSTGIGSTSKPTNEAVEIMLAPNQYTHLTMDLILPHDLMLNTRIVVSFEVIAGMNEEQQPYQLSYDALIIVDQQRKLSGELSEPSGLIHATGVGVPLFVNLSSTSSQTEMVMLQVDAPDDWQIVCNGVLVGDEGQNLSFEAGHLTPQLTDVPCTLHRMAGPLEEKVSFSVTSIDGQITWEDAQVFTFAERANDDVSMNIEVIAGGMAGVLAFTLLLTVLLRKRNAAPIFEEDETKEFVPEITPAGPPVSNGPPVSQGTEDNVIETTTAMPTEVPHPPLPDGGLPAGWTMEQWKHYGDQYLNRLEGQA